MNEAGGAAMSYLIAIIVALTVAGGAVQDKAATADGYKSRPACVWFSVEPDDQ
jgi:hypothetical protein